MSFIFGKWCVFFGIKSAPLMPIYDPVPPPQHKADASSANPPRPVSSPAPSNGACSSSTASCTLRSSSKAGPHSPSLPLFGGFPSSPAPFLTRQHSLPLGFERRNASASTSAPHPGLPSSASARALSNEQQTLQPCPHQPPSSAAYQPYQAHLTPAPRIAELSLGADDSSTDKAGGSGTSSPPFLKTKTGGGGANVAAANKTRLRLLSTSQAGGQEKPGASVGRGEGEDGERSGTGLSNALPPSGLGRAGGFAASSSISSAATTAAAFSPSSFLSQPAPPQHLPHTGTRLHASSPPSALQFRSPSSTGVNTSFWLRTPPPLYRSLSYGGESRSEQIARVRVLGAGNNSTGNMLGTNTVNQDHHMGPARFASVSGGGAGGTSPTKRGAQFTPKPFSSSPSGPAGCGGGDWLEKGATKAGRGEVGSESASIAPGALGSRAFFPEGEESTSRLATALRHSFYLPQCGPSNLSPSHSDQEGSVNSTSSSASSCVSSINGSVVGGVGKEGGFPSPGAVLNVTNPSPRTNFLSPSSQLPSAGEATSCTKNPYGYPETGAGTGMTTHPSPSRPAPPPIPSSLPASSTSQHAMGIRSPMVQAREKAVAQLHHPFQLAQQQQQHLVQAGLLPLSYMSHQHSSGSLHSQGPTASGDEGSEPLMGAKIANGEVDDSGWMGAGSANSSGSGGMSALYARRRSNSMHSSMSSFSSPSLLSMKPLKTGQGANMPGSHGGFRGRSRGSLNEIGKEDVVPLAAAHSPGLRGVNFGGNVSGWVDSTDVSSSNTSINGPEHTGGAYHYSKAGGSSKGHAVTWKAWKELKSHGAVEQREETEIEKEEDDGTKDAARRHNDRVLTQRLEEAVSFGRKTGMPVGADSTGWGSNDSGKILRKDRSDSAGRVSPVSYEFGLWKANCASDASPASRRRVASLQASLDGERGEEHGGIEHNSGERSSHDPVDPLGGAHNELTSSPHALGVEVKRSHGGEDAMNVSLVGEASEEEEPDKEGGNVGDGNSATIRSMRGIMGEQASMNEATWRGMERCRDPTRLAPYKEDKEDRPRVEMMDKEINDRPRGLVKNRTETNASFRKRLHNNASEDVARGDWEDLEEAVDHATVQNNQDKYIDNEQQRKVRLQHHRQRMLVATTSMDATEKGLSGDKEWKDAPASERIDWRKGAQIGKGTFGNVFVGLNASTGERFAVKQIGLVDGSRAEVARLEREILLMKRLRHKHIVQYLGTARDTHALFIFMEYVPGGSIASMLGQYGAFGEALTRRLVAQIVSGIAYLHSMGIIHRDVKGANVLVTNNGIAKLADFGCSRQLQDLQTAASVSLENSLKNITGSVPWMAPEVIKQSGRLPKAADVWSLGATIIEMATAAHPWPEFSNQLAALFHVATSTQPPSLPSSMSNVGKDFLTRCLAIDEKQRATAEELLQHPFIAQEVAMENGNDRIGGEEATASSFPLRPGKRNHGGQSEGKLGKDGREPSFLP